MQISNQKELKRFIEKAIQKNAKKIRGRHSPIAEIVNEILNSLPVKFIYDLRQFLNHFYFIGVKNSTKHPKLRYFLAISLANNSSDLLVQLAKDYAAKNDLKLIQYSIFLKTLRIQLLALREIKLIEDYENSIDLLKEFRKDFRERLMRIKKTVENK